MAIGFLEQQLLAANPKQGAQNIGYEVVLTNMTSKESKVFKHYAPNIQEQLQASYNETVIMGRSAPIVTYASTGARTVTVVLHLTAEDNVKYDVLANVAWIQSLKFPEYNSLIMVPPPKVRLTVGRFLSVVGVVTMADPTWSEAIFEGSVPSHAEISVTLKEVRDKPLGAKSAMQSFYRGV